MKKFTFLFVLSFFYSTVYSQVGINTSTPRSTLDISYTGVPNQNTGILIPSVTTAQRDAMGTVGSTVVLPSNGQMVFDSTLGNYYYYSTNYTADDCTGSGYRTCKWQKVITSKDLRTGTARSALFASANVTPPPPGNCITDADGNLLISSRNYTLTNASNLSVVNPVDLSAAGQFNVGDFNFTFNTPVANTDYYILAENNSIGNGTTASGTCANSTTPSTTNSFFLTNKTTTGFTIHMTNGAAGGSGDFAWMRWGFNFVIIGIVVD